jgi:hypothetical protein
MAALIAFVDFAGVQSAGALAEGSQLQIFQVNTENAVGPAGPLGLVGESLITMGA